MTPTREQCSELTTAWAQAAPEEALGDALFATIVDATGVTDRVVADATRLCSTPEYDVRAKHAALGVDYPHRRS